MAVKVGNQDYKVRDPQLEDVFAIANIVEKMELKLDPKEMADLAALATKEEGEGGKKLNSNSIFGINTGLMLITKLGKAKPAFYEFIHSLLYANNDSGERITPDKGDIKKIGLKQLSNLFNELKEKEDFEVFFKMGLKQGSKENQQN